MRPLLHAPCLFIALAATAGCAAAAAGSPAFELRTDDYQRVRGAYVLEDGHVVQVEGTRRHPRVEFDDGRSQALEAASATDFATQDGCTRLRFELNENTTLARVSVTHPRACASH